MLVNALRCLPSGVWMTLVLVTTLCTPVPIAAQSSSAPSVEEAEASVGLERAGRKRIQRGLRALGFNPGAADGLFGPRTRKAIGAWQSSRGERATGYLNAESARVLREAAPAVAHEVLDVLSEALSTARGITGAGNRARALSGIAGVQADAGDRAGAARSIAEALSTAQGIPDVGERARALNVIPWAQAKTGAIAEALSTARTITEAAHRAWALGTIAEAQAQAGDRAGATRSITEALSTARTITEAAHRAWALGTIGGVQADAGDRAGATRSITEALSTARGIADAGERASALRIISWAQAKTGAIAEALSTARGITDAGERASALGAIAWAQARAGDHAGAARSVTEALSTARGITDAGERASALSIIAGAQAQAGAVADALSAARGITDAAHRAWAFRGIAEALSSVRNSSKADGSPTQHVDEQPQEAEVPCDAWNTGRFFRHAESADVFRCLKTNDPHARDERGRTPLHVAAMVSDQPAVIAALSKAGAKLDARDDKGRTPLHLAAGLATTPATVTALVNAGAALDARDDRGRTPLQVAETFSEAPAVVNALREATETAGAPSAAPAVASCDNWNTGAFFARADGATITRCLDDGANVHARDETGATPLHTAAGHSQEAAVVRALLSAGARLGARDETGATPLHTATATGTNAAVVEALLEAGADTAARDETGRTPGDYVAENSSLADTDAARRLAGASCDDWNTARFFEHADAATISRCLDDGADVRAFDANGMTPLHFAAAHTTAPEAIQALLDAGADASAIDSDGKAAWHHAGDNPALRGTDIYWRLNEARFH